MILHARQSVGRLLLSTFFAFFCVIVTAAKAEGQPTKKEEASQRFQKGVELYDNGNMRAAFIEFRRAYKLVPTYQLLFNLGQVAAELNDYVEAYNYYKLYLRKGKDKISSDRRQEVKAQIKQLEGFLASIRIRVSEDGAEVTIDGVVIGESPMYQPRMLNAGRHKIVVTLEGFAPWERKVDVASRDEEDLQVELVSLTSDPDEAVDNPFVDSGESSDDKRYTRAFWTSATITGLLAAGTGFAAIQTLRARDVYNKNLAGVPNRPINVQLAADNYKQLALLTDIGVGLTLVGVVSTLLLANRKDAKSTDRSSLRMDLSPSHVALSGAF